MRNLLKTENLYVKADGEEILKGIDFKIDAGQIQAILGPNASGKSTFSQAILGNPRYKTIKGKIFFKGKEITRLSPEKRVRLGMALSWQSPPAIRGVKLSQLLKKISAKREPLSVKLEGSSSLLERETNVDFSGGEKKISELLQILSLSPRLVIFDEIDSGLDIQKLKKVSEIIKRELVDKKIAVLLITHWGQILNYLKPDLVNVMVAGKIICREKNFKKVLKVIKKYGYEKCKECPKFLAD